MNVSLRHAVMFQLTELQEEMKAVGGEMQAIDDEQFQRHGRELCSAAGIALDWIEELHESVKVEVNGE